MPSDEEIIKQAGEILMLAFAEHWQNAWSTLEEGIEQVTEMRVDERICRAAMIDKQIVGWIGGLPDYGGNVWILNPLAVHPDHQGKGVGRLLIEDFERLVAEKGALTIMLGSDDEDDMTSLSNSDLYDNLPDKIAKVSNFKNHPFTFYQHMGYSIIGVVPDANGVGKPDIIMGKRVKR